MAKYSLDKKFIDFVVKNTLGYLTTRELDELFYVIDQEFSARYFDKSAETNFYRIIEAQLDKGNFIREFLKYPHHLEIIAAISVFSNYLCDILTVHPEYVNLIFNPTRMQQKIDAEDLKKEITASFKKLKSIRSKVNFLKALKMRYMLKIAVNDLLGASSLKETTGALSVLAESLLSELFDICYAEVCSRYGLNLSAEYTLISLGKLGGRELNYSSDVDLMAFYKNNYLIEEDLEYHQILSETIKLFISYASDPTEKGYLYRIDFRLRPDGQSSPLCRTLNDAIHYYEARGEDWEKQMLLKMNFLTGNKSVYSSFESFVSKYIFRSVSADSVKTVVKRMKNAIENRLSNELNVKFFTGGIRDIEFSVQALQIINGKKYGALFNGNTMEAIDLLKSKKLLSPEEAQTLKDAYVFYRRIEHFLQLMNDRQVHEIPDKKETLERLRSLFGYKSLDKLLSELEKKRKAVRNIFNSITQNQPEAKTPLSFKDEKRMRKNLSFLESGKGLVGSKEFDSKTISLFNEIKDVLFKEISATPNRDRALENFTQLVKACGFPSIFYSQCKSNTFLSTVVKICSVNEFAIQRIIAKPELSEIILSSFFLSENREDAAVNYNAYQYQLLLSLQYSLGLITREKIGRHLAFFAKEKIKALCKRQEANFPVLILALGSFATAEMNLTSDIDLIFLIEDISKFPNAQENARKLLSDIKETLRPFEIDCRLRPEGESSPLIWEAEEYRKYILKRARIWEFQSLLKIDLIAGNKGIYNNILGTIKNAARNLAEKEIKKEMLDIYRKIRSAFIRSSSSVNLKKDHGGLMTIDFISAYFSLSKENLFGLNLGTNTSKRLENLIENLPELSSELTRLKSNWHFLLDLQTVLCVTLDRKKTQIRVSDKEEIDKIENFTGEKDLTEKLEEVMKFNGRFFNRIFLES